MSMAELDRTLAFTALLKLHPTFGQERPEDHQGIIGDLAGAMTAANPKDRWAFAEKWIAERVAADRLAREDKRGAPYVVPSWDADGKQIPVDYHLALAIARSKHPSRVLAITDVYRFGKFTECPPDGRHPGSVVVRLFGNKIAEFFPEGVQLWTCGYATQSTTEALGNLVSGGWFYTSDRVVRFRRYGDGGDWRTGKPAVEGAIYPYVTRETS